MKHYKELIEIETQIINLDVLRALVRVMVTGMPNASPLDIEYSMYHIEDQMKRIHGDLQTKFNVLFNNIRDEDNKDEAKTKRSRAKKQV